MAFVLNNKAFVDLKNGKIENIYNHFLESKEILETTKIHETAYPLVNMALCNMFSDNFESAKEILLEALIWNRSPYLKYVINTHLAICYFHLGECEDYERISKSLYTTLFEGDIIDGTIIRKISINLALLFIGNNDINKASMCLDYAKNYVNGTSSEYRFNKIYASIHNEKFSDTCPYCEYYSTLKFEPWGVTLSHD